MKKIESSPSSTSMSSSLNEKEKESALELAKRKIRKEVRAERAKKTVRKERSTLERSASSYFYKNFFPSRFLFRLLNSCSKNSEHMDEDYMAHLEIAEEREEGLFARKLSFSTSELFGKYCEESIPAALHLCSWSSGLPHLRNMQGKDWVTMEKPLVFDVDLDSYGKALRTCCGDEKKMCKNCSTLCKIAMASIAFVLSRFGFDERRVRFFFSGRKGIHCWVFDKRAFGMLTRDREQIVSLLSPFDEAVEIRRQYRGQGGMSGVQKKLDVTEDETDSSGDKNDQLKDNEKNEKGQEQEKIKLSGSPFSRSVRGRDVSDYIDYHKKSVICMDLHHSVLEGGFELLWNRMRYGDSKEFAKFVLESVVSAKMRRIEEEGRTLLEKRSEETSFVQGEDCECGGKSVQFPGMTSLSVLYSSIFNTVMTGNLTIANSNEPYEEYVSHGLCPGSRDALDLLKFFRVTLGESKKQLAQDLYRDVVAATCLPRLDKKVTLDREHLIKMPWGTKSSNGKICLELKNHIGVFKKRCSKNYCTNDDSSILYEEIEFDPSDEARFPSYKILYDSNNANRKEATERLEKNVKDFIASFSSVAN